MGNLVLDNNKKEVGIEKRSIPLLWQHRWWGIDFRQDVPQLEVPFYVLDGTAELSARRDLTLECFAQVDAPIKRIFTFDNAAHAPAFGTLRPSPAS